MPEDFHAMQQRALRQMEELRAKAPKEEPLPPKEASPETPKNQPPAQPRLTGLLARFLHMDNDTALVLPLLLLLSREGADDPLLLALLYLIL